MQQQYFLSPIQGQNYPMQFGPMLASTKLAKSRRPQPGKGLTELIRGEVLVSGSAARITYEINENWTLLNATRRLYSFRNGNCSDFSIYFIDSSRCTSHCQLFQSCSSAAPYTRLFYLLLACHTGEKCVEGSTSSLTERTNISKHGPSVGKRCTSSLNARTASRNWLPDSYSSSAFV